MFFEDVKVLPGETVSGLALAYGYKATEWRKIWDHSRNSTIVRLRGKPEKLQVGDVLQVYIPWKVTSQSLTPMPDGGQLIAKRDGELGKRLTWVQTVYRHNQPVGPNPNPFCVDACTPDDDLPFYWTNKEIKDEPNLRKEFRDYSNRDRPTAAMGETRWRAVLSLAAVTQKRVTIWNSIVWGWNLPVIGPVSTVGPRPATALEVQGHLNLLRKGAGTGPLTFEKGGWSFREAVRAFDGPIGDFPTPRRNVQYA